MKTNNENEKNVYVQPDCKVYQVQVKQCVLTMSTELLNEEEFNM